MQTSMEAGLAELNPAPCPDTSENEFNETVTSLIYILYFYNYDCLVMVFNLYRIESCF